MTQQETLQLSENLRDWFKTRTDKKTGKKFKGWVNCKTGGPCGRKKAKGSKRPYPACRPKSVAGRISKKEASKKKGPKRVSWSTTASGKKRKK